MELYLTSSIYAVAHDIASRVNMKNNKLVFIMTAAEKERGDKSWEARDRRALVMAGFNVTDYTITGKNRRQLETDLSKFKFIYLSGGNTGYLLGQSQKGGFASLIKELILKKNKIYIGTSAGSIIAGPRLPDYFSDEYKRLKNQNCYNFVNFTVLPHWGSEHFKKKYFGGRMKMVYKEKQVPLLLLTDNQYVHIYNNNAQIVEVK